MTECSQPQHTLDGPGVDLKVVRNVYKDSCSISRKWNRCPRRKKKNPTLIFKGSVHVIHGGWCYYCKKMSGINHRPHHRCHGQMGRLAGF